MEVVPAPSWVGKNCGPRSTGVGRNRSRTRREKNALIHSTSRAEKWATFAILSFILIVAAFNILAALTMLLLDKRRDIGTLSAMGMTPRDIRRVFSWQGFLINAVGAAGGLALGLTLVWLQDQYGLVRLEGAMVPRTLWRCAGDVLGVCSWSSAWADLQRGDGRVPRPPHGARRGVILSWSASAPLNW